MHHFFAYMARMRFIDRWALMRNSYTENIQEHSHMAAVLAHALGTIRRDVLGGDCDPDRCAAAALFHDATELFTGEEDPEIRRLVKAADKLSAYIKCLEELKSGNDEFGDAARVTLEALHAMELPEVEWFLDNCAGGFGLTLDQLG